ncbi:transcriptional regulator, AsnC family [Phyllobacterium sp. YR620]|uniref:Lrp/AsnC family transcriptional regulator n=1 Tax=Phyllobacterium pellucidum TaxID=2740464 RepID=A0A849VSI8_9HYPH|nr:MULTISPECIES: Lrp/AsnC family transcriptional regulator [Phyllobacterium]NTS31924.1 Lrp/AsnC family transcriptional regulator [Phyllobacterium pellucidum]UGY09366.1 Lrp/AsnC family transcriptional regulator [Phyllobacterium sp. T1018]SDO84836.1 transcriptional regulator, AsnC family [Phyllobacterium sp. YR620]SFJ34136.1 transcriptional regulator, AsnC family [Phyllobacterium sp. CL33Tsu]
MFDDRDRKILDLLQNDASLGVSELAERVNLSVSACSRRIQRLEEEGFIARRVVLLDRPLMGLPTTMFVIVRTARHSAEWLEQFRKAINDIPEIVEVHRMTGTIDYILKLVLPRVEAYDGIYRTLVERVEFFDISASVSMEILKTTTAVPTRYVR